MGGAGDGSRLQRRKRKLAVPISKPISTQSGESVAGAATSLNPSSSAVGYSSQSVLIEEKQSVFSSCEMKNSSVGDVCTVVTLAAHQQVEVEEENMQGSSSNKDVELHSVSVEECMRGSPAKARVVYAPVEEIGGEGCLLRACSSEIITEAKAGLVLEKDAKQTLKLHATLMNARHRKRKKGARRQQDSFDARGIFLRYGSEHWGDHRIQGAHLSRRFKFDEGGYYCCCASIPFPESDAN